MCTHPVLPQEPEYPQGDVGWRRDGTVISTTGLANKTNSTTTYLQFTIAEDTTGNYTCLLVNAVRGGIVESNSVPVRPRGECNMDYLYVRRCVHLRILYKYIMICQFALNHVQIQCND